MRIVIQKCLEASVGVAGTAVSNINRGLVILWGIEEGDGWDEADYCIRKALNIKLWHDDADAENTARESGQKSQPGGYQPEGKKTWAKSVKDMSFEILIISQFTLFASVKKGNKPDFHRAMNAQQAQLFFEQIVAKFRCLYQDDRIHTGAFGTYMEVSLVNDGPVTVIVEQPSRKTVPAIQSSPAPTPGSEMLGGGDRQDQHSMVKATGAPVSVDSSGGWKKADLISLLSTATSSAQRNRAVKLLRKFEPRPKKELDGEANIKNMKLKKYNSIQAFVCFRCDRVKHTNVKGSWLTSEGPKSICNACFNNLCDRLELVGVREFVANQC